MRRRTERNPIRVVESASIPPGMAFFVPPHRCIRTLGLNDNGEMEYEIQIRRDIVRRCGMIKNLKP